MTAIECGWQREGERVRLFTRTATTGASAIRWIVEAALKNRQQHFVIDGEAVLLGVDGVSDFNGLHSRHMRRRSSFTPSISSR